MTSRHSTQFILIWVLIGLVAGATVIMWPNTTQNGALPVIPLSQGPASYSQAVANAAPSVVSIQAFVKNTANQPFFQQQQSPSLRINQGGSGVILDDRGHIITNNHVIEKADIILVSLYDGRQAEAKVMGTDPESDLAVLTIALKQLPPIHIADMNHLQVGDVVLAIGNPYGIGQTVTQGIISATGRNHIGLNLYENFIQPDAAINPGNSGGALVNARGEIVGINSAIYTPSGGFQGIGFASPINQAYDVVEQIIDHGQVIRGWLGASGLDATPQVLHLMGINENAHGVAILEVMKNGPADRAGIRNRDVITKVDKTEILDTHDLLDIIARGRPGQHITISGIRKGQRFTTEAVLAQRPHESN